MLYFVMHTSTSTVIIFLFFVVVVVEGLPMLDTSYEASSDEMILHEQPHFSKISLPTFSSTPIIEKRSSYTKELSAKKVI